MKFFVAFVALVAVAAATPLHKPATSGTDELAAIIAAINSPNTDPATLPLLQDLLHQALGVDASPVFVDTHEPPSSGPAIIDFPVNEPIDNSPVVVGPIPQGATPLVQIIVNVAGAGAPGAPGAGADAPAEIEGDAVQVVDNAPEEVDAVQVVDLPAIDAPVSGVEVADLPALPVSPVQIGNPQLPAAIVPVQIGTPQFPAAIPAALPEELN